MTKFRTMGLIAACATMTVSAAVMAAPVQPQVQEMAHVPGPHGAMNKIDLLKTGKKLETVTCKDFGMLEESFRPTAVVYGANYGPKGKAHPAVTVDGVENIVPLVVQECAARPGNHFLSAINAAVKANAARK